MKTKNFNKIFFLTIIIVLLSPQVFAGIINEDLDKKIDQLKPSEKIDVILKLRNKAKDQDIQGFEKQNAEIKHKFKYVNAVALKLPVKAVNAISQHASVEIVYPDYEIKTVLKESIPIIGADEVWTFGPTGKNVNIYVLDTGISTPYVNVIESIDFTGEGTQDLNGHGTHVAGIISSKHETYKGTSPDANIHNIKVLNKDGMGYASDVMAGIEHAITKQADIISMSLGAQVTNCDGTDIISQLVNEARQRGIIPVVAAGNLGPESYTITSPGCAEGALTVGAVDKSDIMASFSSRGPTTDGRIKPNMVAPGVGITSTWNDGSFKTLSGTSMATPHIAGSLALLISEGMTKEEAEEYLLRNTFDLGQKQEYQGQGRVNVLASYSDYLKTKQPEETPIEEPEPSPIEPIPTEPTPTEPLPEEPSEPAPTEPTPEEPVPSEPAPIEPIPEEPSEPPVPEEPSPKPSPDKDYEKPKSFFSKAWEIITKLIPTKKEKPKQALERVVEKLENKNEEKLFEEIMKNEPPGIVIIKKTGEPDKVLIPTFYCGDNFCDPNEDFFICPQDCQRKKYTEEKITQPIISKKIISEETSSTENIPEKIELPEQVPEFVKGKGRMFDGRELRIESEELRVEGEDDELFEEENSEILPVQSSERLTNQIEESLEGEKSSEGEETSEESLTEDDREKPGRKNIINSRAKWSRIK